MNFKTIYNSYSTYSLRFTIGHRRKLYRHSKFYHVTWLRLNSNDKSSLSKFIDTPRSFISFNFKIDPLLQFQTRCCSFKSNLKVFKKVFVAVFKNLWILRPSITTFYMFCTISHRTPHKPSWMINFTLPSRFVSTAMSNRPSPVLKLIDYISEFHEF